MEEIKLEILKQSYWEHFNVAKNLSLVLPLSHPKRVLIESEVNKINEQILDMSKNK